MTKEKILEEIRRTAKANGGKPLGWRRFEEEAGVGYYGWYGKYWTRWGDAVREAGLEPNQMATAFDDEYLLEKLVLLTRELGRAPVQGDMLLAARRDKSFPSDKVFRRLGQKRDLISRIVTYCESKGYPDVAALWKAVKIRPVKTSNNEVSVEPLGTLGYVYLLQHGSRREFKIGRTNNPLRREGELGIQLPEKCQPIHYIETDDLPGIEAYWHSRFANKRKEGEWFELTAQDVAAFKRWRRIY